jgi:hypothetical protein
VCVCVWGGVGGGEAWLIVPWQAYQLPTRPSCLRPLIPKVRVHTRPHVGMEGRAIVQEHCHAAAAENALRASELAGACHASDVRLPPSAGGPDGAVAVDGSPPEGLQYTTPSI